MLSIEVISTIIQGVLSFVLAWFAYDFLSEFRALRKSVNELNLSMVHVVSRLAHVETDHGRRIDRLESEIL